MAECYEDPDAFGLHGRLLDNCEVPYPLPGIGSCSDSSMMSAFDTFVGSTYSSASFCFEHIESVDIDRRID